MRVCWRWLVLWSLWAARQVRQPTLPVRVAGGWLRGTVAREGTHAAYLGIPYATVTPERRFQPAIPEPTWDGILDATDEQVRCTQRFTNHIIIGKEDCLTLNVFTPLGNPIAPLPVMVYLHGGGFRDGSGSPFLYGPEYLVKHDIILVTVNYRLEILGFLCLGIKEAPGNVGLKDQVEALKWIRKNIAQFSGDPSNITIFGVSAGSASVMFHLMSPMSKGLFHKAIMQSGSTLSPWSFQYDPIETASSLAREMGHYTNDPKELYQLFMQRSPEDILKIRVPRKKGDVILSENIFVPCMEKNSSGSEPFLSELPYDILVNGKYQRVPIIIGYTNAEGYMFIGKENKTTISEFNVFDALPRDLFFPSDVEKRIVADNLTSIYMTNDKLDINILDRIAHYEGDAGIKYSVTATIELLLKTNRGYPMYGYKFCYDGWLNIVKIISGFWNASGASHADDIFYLFKPNFYLPHTYFELLKIKTITAMWTNFAKYGDPTPQSTPELPLRWLPMDKMKPSLFVIDQQFGTEPLWNDQAMLVWNSTYTKYRRKR